MRLTAILFNYNYAHYLPMALDSVWNQTRRPDRIIVSDDRSPRNSEAELRAIVERYPGVELVINPHNLGNVEHYRARVRDVDSEIYFQLSADDYLVDMTFFERAMAELAAEPDVTCVYGYHLPVDDGGHALAHRNVRLGQDKTRMASADLRRELAFENNVPAVCVVIRHSVHDKVPPFPLDNRHCCDWQQWYLLAKLGDMVRLERVVVAYRIHGQNMSVTYEQQGTAHLQMLEAYDQLLAWPGLSEEERTGLEVGRRRFAIRSAALRTLPSLLSRERWDGDTVAMVAETALERLGVRVLRGQARLTRRFLGAGVTKM